MLPYQNIFKGWTWSWAHCGRIHLWKRWNSILSPSNQNSRSLFPVVQLKAKSLLLCEIGRQFTSICWVHQYSKLQSAFSWSLEASQCGVREGGHKEIIPIITIINIIIVTIRTYQQNPIIIIIIVSGPSSNEINNRIKQTNQVFFQALSVSESA